MDGRWRQARFVYFYSGYVLAPYVFPFAATVAANKGDAIRFLLAWALFEDSWSLAATQHFPSSGSGSASSARLR